MGEVGTRLRGDVRGVPAGESAAPEFLLRETRRSKDWGSGKWEVDG